MTCPLNVPNTNLVIFVAFFKLKAQNVLFWALAPTIFFRYTYSQTIDDRVNNLWRIHQNRESRGMGGTFNKAGYYSSDQHTGDTGMPF